MLLQVDGEGDVVELAGALSDNQTVPDLGDLSVCCRVGDQFQGADLFRDVLLVNLVEFDELQGALDLPDSQDVGHRA